MLKTGDKVKIVNQRSSKYNGLTGVITRDKDYDGFFRVDMDENPAWFKEHGWESSPQWKAWTLMEGSLEKIEPPPLFKAGDKVVVEGAQGILDLFNGLEGTVLEVIGDGGCFMVHFEEATVFGVSAHKLVVPVQWLNPAPTEEEKTKEALIKLLDSYSKEPRWLTSARADEIMALVGGK